MHLHPGEISVQEVLADGQDGSSKPREQMFCHIAPIRMPCSRSLPCSPVDLIRIECTSVMSGLGGAPAALPGVDAGRCRRRTGRDLVGAAGQPGHDLGDSGGVAWGHSLGCRPIWATAAVKLGGRSFGELRPALAWRDDLRENGGALDGVRAWPAKERTSRSAAASVGRWDILLGQRRVPPYAAHRRFARRLSIPSGRQRQGDLTPCHF